MILGSEYKAHIQLQMMQRQISLWLNSLDTNPDLLKTLDSNSRGQISYMMAMLKDHLSEHALRILS